MISLAIVDNDIVDKLTAVDLLPDLPGLLGVPASGLRILPTLKWRYLKKRAKAVARLTEQKVNDILAFCERTAAVPNAPDEDVAAMASIQNLDDGELLLISYASRQPDSVLVTGDKRCLAALTTTPSASAVAARLDGRVLCLEQLIVRAIAQLDFEVVRARVVPNMACDTALRASFGSGLLSTQANVESALASQIASLRSSSGRLLVDP